MELTKQQSMQIFMINEKQNSIINKFKFTTKYKWKCLSCGKIIYVSYKQFGRNAIFCEDCFKTSIPNSIVQVQYMRQLKEKQLEIVEKFVNIDIENSLF